LQDKPSNTCVVDLAPNKTLGEGADCLGAWLSEAPTGWFPEPDGIAITGKEGSKIAFFSRRGDGSYTSRLSSELLILLERVGH